MKIPLLHKLKARTGTRRVVRASAARALRETDEDYYEAEPNMKLSHAFMVVLVLHIVAVGGIYAFNKVKVQKNPDILGNISNRIAQAAGTSTAPNAPLVTTSQAPAAPAAAAAAPAAAPALTPARELPPEADEPLPAVVTSMRSTPPALAPAASTPVPAPAVAATKPAAAKPAPAAAARTQDAAPGTYKVAKGDNPYNIAKKLGVKYQDLLSVNGITDPTKLQIGQVLKVPSKAN